MELWNGKPYKWRVIPQNSWKMGTRVLDYGVVSSHKNDMSIVSVRSQVSI